MIPSRKLTNIDEEYKSPMNVKGRDMKENFTMKYVIEQSDKNGYDIIEKEMIKSKLIYEDS